MAAFAQGLDADQPVLGTSRHHRAMCYKHKRWMARPYTARAAVGRQTHLMSVVHGWRSTHESETVFWGNGVWPAESMNDKQPGGFSPPRCWWHSDHCQCPAHATQTGRTDFGERGSLSAGGQGRPAHVLWPDTNAFPGVAQVLRHTCSRQALGGGGVSEKVHFGITSLCREQATLAQVKRLSPRPLDD